MKILFAAPFPIDCLRKIGRNNEEINKNRDFFLFPLINAFYQQGHEIVMVTSSRKIKADEMYSQERLKIYIVKICSHGRISAYLDFKNDIKHITKYVQCEMCDIYHANWCYEYAQACLNVSKSRTLVTMHDWPDVVCPQIGNYYWKKRNKLGNRVIQNTLNFSVVSPYIEDFLTRNGIEARIKMIPNFYDILENANRNYEYQKSRENITFIAVNNGFGTRKNVKVAMKAFEKLHKQFSNSQLYLFGDGFEYQGIAYQWAEKNVDISGMNFVGKVPRSQIISAFQDADILIHTAIEEAFGLIYLEAMATNTLIIAGEKSGATPWVLNYGMAGLLADVTSEEDVYIKMQYAMENDNERRDICKNAYQWLIQKFSLDSVQKSYEQYYKKILDK